MIIDTAAKNPRCEYAMTLDDVKPNTQFIIYDAGMRVIRRADNAPIQETFVGFWGTYTNDYGNIVITAPVAGTA